MKDMITGAYRRFKDGKTPREPQFVGDATRLSRVVAVLQRRQSRGQVTTLRQLHKVCDLDQREAFALLGTLKRANVVTINENMSDEFESAVVLNEDAPQRLADFENDEAA